MELVRPLVDRRQTGPYLRAACVAVAVPALLRLPLDRLQVLLEPSPRRSRRRGVCTTDPPGVTEVLATADAAVAALRPLARRGCLTSGVTRYDALRRADVAVALCFGVSLTPSGVPGDLGTDGPVGHCWLELYGEPLGESRDPRAVYRETYRLCAQQEGTKGRARV